MSKEEAGGGHEKYLTKEKMCVHVLRFSCQIAWFHSTGDNVRASKFDQRASIFSSCVGWPRHPRDVSLGSELLRTIKQR